VLGSPLAGYDGRAGGVILMMEQDDRADVDDGRTAEVGKAR
jgi:hypothetical protein